jgi:hypothetical protein
MIGSLLAVLPGDGGFGIITMAIIGAPFGFIADYIWNFIVFSLATRFFPGCKEIHTDLGERIVFIIFVSVLGLIIDWPYFEITWDVDFTSHVTSWLPAMPQWLQFVALLLPMALIAIADAALAWAYLRLEKKQAVILGAILGFFTAPWLLPVIPYAFHWVV